MTNESQKVNIAMLMAMVSEFDNVKRYDYTYSREFVLSDRVGDQILEDHFLIEDGSEVYYWRESKDIIGVERGNFIYGNHEYSEITYFGGQTYLFRRDFHRFMYKVSDRKDFTRRVRALNKLSFEHRDWNLYYLPGDPFEDLGGRDLPNGIHRYGSRYGTVEKHVYLGRKNTKYVKPEFEFQDVEPVIVEKNINYISAF